MERGNRRVFARREQLLTLRLCVENQGYESPQCVASNSRPSSLRRFPLPWRAWTTTHDNKCAAPSTVSVNPMSSPACWR